ncbi:hypothetical protein B7G54_31580 [Burkholderia puraquae]|uniref:Uncharacterized protein n=1 Tax=Burkholderia puraquae TaxID=1904757 RepID=A0A1X1P828_9BURK|nr:hypothetical protein B7G54_31580 [Burkholderia puraquae]
MKPPSRLARFPVVAACSHSRSGRIGATSSHVAPSPFVPRFFTSSPRPAHDFFRLGGVTRTSSSAVISGHLNRTVPSRSDLRQTPARQGFAAFVTGSATGRGTR